MLRNLLLGTTFLRMADDGAGAGAGGQGGGADAGGKGAAEAGNKGAGAGDGKPFYEGLGLDAAADKDIIDFYAAKNFPDFKTAARQQITADKLVRERNALTRPDKDKLDDWEGHEALGWIKDESKYLLKDPDAAKLPDGFQFDKDMRGAFQKIAHKHRVPLARAQAIADEILDLQTKGFSDRKAAGAGALAATNETLEKEFGNDLPVVKEKARRAMEFAMRGSKADPSILAEMDKGMSSPGLVKFFHWMHEQIGEQAIGAQANGGGGMGLSYSQLEAKLNAWQADPANMAALNDQRHGQHKDKVAERQAIIDQMAKTKRAA